MSSWRCLFDSGLMNGCSDSFTHSSSTLCLRVSVSHLDAYLAVTSFTHPSTNIGYFVLHYTAFLLVHLINLIKTAISHCCRRSNETGLRFTCGWPEIKNLYWYQIDQIGCLCLSYFQRAGSGNLIGWKAHTHKVIHNRNPV